MSTVGRVYVLKTELLCKLFVDGTCDLGEVSCLCPLLHVVVFMFLKRNYSVSYMSKEHKGLENALLMYVHCESCLCSKNGIIILTICGRSSGV